MADHSIRKFISSFLESVPPEIADQVVHEVIKSDETIPINSSDGDLRATAEECLAFQDDIFQAYEDGSHRAALREQFFATNTFSITLSGPRDFIKVDSEGRRFYSINLTPPQRQLLQHVKRLVILVRIHDFDTFDTYRRRLALRSAMAEVLTQRASTAFEDVVLHFHFNNSALVPWAMRTLGMAIIMQGMVLGGDFPHYAPQLRFVLTDASSHPLFDPAMVHKLSDVVTTMEWTADNLRGFARTVVYTLFGQARGKPLRVAWK